GRALGPGRGRRRGAQTARAGAHAGARLRRAVTRAHPAPRQLGAHWRAQRIWTDETLLDRLDAAPEAQLAIVDGDVRSTIGDLRAVAQGYAATLHDLGVRPGDIVCWQLPNWWEAVAFCWGVWRCGAIASPINPTVR